MTFSGLSRWWRVHFEDGEPVESFMPLGASKGEILKAHPTATAVEPFEPPKKWRKKPMTDKERWEIIQFCYNTGETDFLTIDGLLTECEKNPFLRGRMYERAVGRDTTYE
ncbi:MAG: hypothetical protein LBV29_05505 [Azoarcus sp.]|jgi:hypothetical protein|nr:hypothetical protein [Azoarcus sp.]